MTLKQYSGMAVVNQKLSESTARMWTPPRPSERNRDLQTSRQSQKSVSVETKEGWERVGMYRYVLGIGPKDSSNHSRAMIRKGHVTEGLRSTGAGQATTAREGTHRQPTLVLTGQGRKWRAHCAQEERCAFSRFAFPLPSCVAKRLLSTSCMRVFRWQVTENLL